MNFKACTFGRLAFAPTLGVFIFYLVLFRPWDPTESLDIWKKTKHFFNNAEPG